MHVCRAEQKPVWLGWKSEVETRGCQTDRQCPNHIGLADHSKAFGLFF